MPHLLAETSLCPLVSPPRFSDSQIPSTQSPSTTFMLHHAFAEVQPAHHREDMPLLWPDALSAAQPISGSIRHSPTPLLDAVSEVKQRTCDQTETSCSVQIFESERSKLQDCLGVRLFISVSQSEVGKYYLTGDIISN